HHTYHHSRPTRRSSDLPGLQGRRVTPAPHAILIPMLREKGELMTSPTRFLDLNTARELAEALAASGQDADARLVLRSIDRIEEQARFLRHVGQSAVAEGVWEPEVPVSECREGGTAGTSADADGTGSGPQLRGRRSLSRLRESGRLLSGRGRARRG